MRIRGGESALLETGAELPAEGEEESSQQEAEPGFLSPSLDASQLWVADGASSSVQEQQQEEAGHLIRPRGSLGGEGSGHLISPRASSDLDPGFFAPESPRGQTPPREERPATPRGEVPLHPEAAAAPSAPQQPAGASPGKANLGAALSRGLTWAKQQRQQGSLQEQGRKAASALASRVQGALAEAQARKAARKAAAAGDAPE